ncbi:MAG: calcium-binding protein, partial [Gammaproteobacteria bacterium]|nr:calcium-binding protein [Gammaproteobacteria bacterium]
GDGFDDLVVGAYGADPNGALSGSSYVVFGKAARFAATINLSTLNGTNGFRLDGVAAEDFSGIAVSAAGDVNGDGFDDLVVGAFGADPNGDYSGSSYVIFGRDFTGTVAQQGGTGNDILTGTVAAENLVGGLGDDTLNGGAGADVLKGAAGQDSLNGASGSDRLEGGTGNDSLNGGDDADRLDGGVGADTLDGGLGSDVLIGGADHDVFLFNDSVGSTNVDRLMDFGGAGVTVMDIIHLDNAIFTALPVGALAASSFEAGAGLTAAATGNGRIVYDTTSGGVYYDRDGSGGVAAVQFATLASAVDGLAGVDFFVV